MGETVSLDEFRDFCNEQLTYVLDQGYGDTTRLPGDITVVHYETPGGVNLRWINGNIVEAHFIQLSDRDLEKEVTVDFNEVPPQVHEVTTTPGSRKSRTLKGHDRAVSLAEVSKYISLIPVQEVDAEVLDEANRVVARLNS